MIEIRRKPLKILEYFEEIKLSFVTRNWSNEDKLTITKLIHRIYNSDAVFTSEESKHYQSLLDNLNVSIDALVNFDVVNGMDNLKKDPDKMEYVYSWIGDAILRDGNFLSEEKEFVKDFAKKFGLSEEKIVQEVNKKLKQ